MITNMNDNELRLGGENKVLRGLLTEALSVLETIGFVDEEEAESCESLTVLKNKITAALHPTPQEVLL